MYNWQKNKEELNYNLTNRINAHESELIQINNWTDKWMGKKRKIPYVEQSQIVCVDNLSLSWGIIHHSLSVVLHRVDFLPKGAVWKGVRKEKCYSAEIWHTSSRWLKLTSTVMSCWRCAYLIWCDKNSIIILPPKS